MPHLTFRFLATLLLCTGAWTTSIWAAPKHLLVVTTTMGFRHSSIEVGEKVMRELAEKTGEFTLEFASVNPRDPRFQDNNETSPAKVEEAIRQTLAEKMNAQALQRFDGVVFLNTTGSLPIPDMAAFLEWLRAGHAFIGMHSASDTFHGADDPSEYTQMLNGEFLTHGPQETVVLHNIDPNHAATKELAPSMTVHEEMYLFKNYRRGIVHSLLNMNEHPNERTAGHYPVSWCRAYGQGRVFYTSLGHREDIWDPTWTEPNGKRQNPPEVAEAYQRHILGGIRWATGQAEGSAEPQVAE